MIDKIYNSNPFYNIKTMYQLLNSEKMYKLFKETLDLPNIRKINNDLFIKTYEYLSNGIVRYKRFFIVVDKNGKVLSSYNNQYVKLNPKFGLLCGMYHNQVISKDTLEILYFTPLNALEIDQIIGNESKYSIHSFDHMGEISMNELFNTIHDYAKNFPWS